MPRRSSSSAYRPNRSNGREAANADRAESGHAWAWRSEIRVIRGSAGCHRHICVALAVRRAFYVRHLAQPSDRFARAGVPCI